MGQIENLIESSYRDLHEQINNDYCYLYSCFDCEKLEILLSTLHSMFINSFKEMNSRLPTAETEAYFWADSSRHLIKTIEDVENLQDGLVNSKYAFKLDSYYKETVALCKTFYLNRILKVRHLFILRKSCPIFLSFLPKKAGTALLLHKPLSDIPP